MDWWFVFYSFLCFVLGILVFCLCGWDCVWLDLLWWVLIMLVIYRLRWFVFVYCVGYWYFCFWLWYRCYWVICGYWCFLDLLVFSGWGWLWSCVFVCVCWYSWVFFCWWFRICLDFVGLLCCWFCCWLWWSFFWCVWYVWFWCYRVLCLDFCLLCVVFFKVLVCVL